jgi:predicted enzyme related to lactoylglutathione lyase
LYPIAAEEIHSPTRRAGKEAGMAEGIGRLQYIVIDANDPDRLAAFWSALLGTEVDARLGDNDYVLLKATENSAPPIAFQKVPEPHAAKNRVHIDVAVADLAEASARVVELGGAILGEPQELEGYRWQNLADPEGNEFDVALA